MIHWPKVDTVLLDMDGTLLDLHYDTHMWMHVLPQRIAARDKISLEQAKRQLFNQFENTARTIDYYCMDFWSKHTNMDIMALHHEFSDLISFLPGAENFLTHLKCSSLTVRLVTNAHRANLTLKNKLTGLTTYVNEQISSLDFREPKENQRFWQALMQSHPFDPQRTLLIDDNEDVLDAAHEYGIAHLLSVKRPDTQRPEKEGSKYPTLATFDQLLPIAQ
ncbi:MAG: GMP/IMP nucleotidase [Pseudomonadales bacterium]|nr:GMP/IMP nucleotidase [Pseudomonadales bacterium]